MVSEILKDGNVDFSKSDTDAEPCHIYYISKNSENSSIELEIENCDSIAKIQKAYIKKDE